MIPIARPSTSPCGGPPPNCGLATYEPARNAVTASVSRRSSPAATDCSRRRRGAGGNEGDRRSGKVWARKFMVAHGCGLIINPDGLRGCIEGNVVQGT
jgi:nicotinate dehydrogenase subunit B